MVIFLSLTSILAQVGTNCNGSSNGSSSGHSNLPECGTLSMDTTTFSLSEMSLQYDLLKENASDADRVELSVAHFGFYDMTGEINILQNILINSDNYSLENKPSIIADFSFDNCQGAVHREFSKEEVVGNTVYNVPYQPFKLTGLTFTIHSIRTNSGFQYLWPGKVLIENDMWGSLSAIGERETKLTMKGVCNTRTGSGGFAGLFLDQYDDLIAYENTIDSTFIDSHVLVTINDEDFYFSSTLSKSIYIHGIFDSTIRWAEPTIFVIEDPDPILEEGE